MQQNRDHRFSSWESCFQMGILLEGNCILKELTFSDQLSLLKRQKFLNRSL